MKRPSLRVPAALAVAIVAVPAALALAVTSCGGDDGDDPPKDSSLCYPCYAAGGDAGTPDGGCPLCADLSSGAPICPVGCDTPIG